MARNPLYPDALQPVEMQGNDLIGYKPTLADGWDYNAKAYNDWVAQQQADLVARGLNDPQTGWPTQAGWLDAAHQIGNSLLMGTTAPGIRAFHGSPHDFDAFQLSKIGSGEGAQAYGHGLYFAGDEAVARSYRDQLTRRDGAAGAAATVNYAPGVVADWQKNAPGRFDHVERAYDLGARTVPANATADELNQAAIGHLKSWQNSYLDDASKIKGSNADAYRGKAAEIGSVIDDINAGKVGGASTGTGGRMYEVNLGVNPDHMLDWDKPLSEQHPVVQDSVNRALRYTSNEPVHVGVAGLRDNMSGGDIIRGAPDQAALSQVLAEHGIPGIRYLDGQSRTAGEGTSNYVMFNPKNIEILRKYGLAGLMAGGTAAAASDQ